MSAVTIVVVLIILGLIIAYFVMTFLYTQAIRDDFSQLNSELRGVLQAINRDTFYDCSTAQEYSYPRDLTLFENTGYDAANSQVLLLLSLNVTASNCKNIGLSTPSGFTSITRLEGNDPVTNQRVLFGYFLRNPSNNMTVIAFTGTYSLSEWIEDINFPQVAASALNNYETGVDVSRGFYDIYLTVRSQIWDLYNSSRDNISQLVITGHSLGGALSTLCVFDFGTQRNVYHYSYAAPAQGTPVFANKFDAITFASWRTYNTADIVPCLPPPVLLGFVYQHCGHGNAFNDNQGNLIANHTDAYIQNAINEQ